MLEAQPALLDVKASILPCSENVVQSIFTERVSQLRKFLILILSQVLTSLQKSDESVKLKAADVSNVIAPD